MRDSRRPSASEPGMMPEHLKHIGRVVAQCITEHIEISYRITDMFIPCCCMKFLCFHQLKDGTRLLGVGPASLCRNRHDVLDVFPGTVSIRVDPWIENVR